MARVYVATDDGCLVVEAETEREAKLTAALIARARAGASETDPDLPCAAEHREQERLERNARRLEELSG